MFRKLEKFKIDGLAALNGGRQGSGVDPNNGND